MSAELQEQMLSSIKLSKYFGIITAPLIVLLKWGISAFLLFALAIVFGADISYRKALSVLAHASIITALDAMASVAVIYLRGLETVQSAGDIQTTLLNPAYLLGASANLVLRTVLESLNLFSLWYFVLLAMRLYRTARLTSCKAALVIGLALGLGAGRFTSGNVRRIDFEGDQACLAALPVVLSNLQLVFNWSFV